VDVSWRDFPPPVDVKPAYQPLPLDEETAIRPGGAPARVNETRWIVWDLSRTLVLFLAGLCFGLAAGAGEPLFVVVGVIAEVVWLLLTLSGDGPGTS
jgi:hypothetical protein